MQRRLLQLIFPITFTLTFLPTTSSAVDSWPQWRGEHQNGVATGDDFPVQWSAATGIAWQTDLPGMGGSTPIISNGTAYITTGAEGKNQLLAFDLETGKRKWAVTVGTDRGNKHRKGSGSNPSPVVDGDNIFAYFRSGDLASIDSNGENSLVKKSSIVVW